MREPAFFFFFTFTRSFDLSTSLLEFRFISHAQMRNFWFCEIFTERVPRVVPSPRNIICRGEIIFKITFHIRSLLMVNHRNGGWKCCFYYQMKQNCSKSGDMQISIEFINDTIGYYVTFQHVPSYLISDTKAIGLTRRSRQ